MTNIIIDALNGYFSTLYELNQNVIKLCGFDVGDNDGEQCTVIVNDIVHSVPKIIPYAKIKNCDELYINPRDGLIEFSEDLYYLKDGYNDILKNNYEFLGNIKKIRNKTEHKLHDVRIIAYGSGSLDFFDFSFTISKAETITLTAGELIKFIKQMNELFSKIQSDVETYMWENKKSSSAYCRRLTRFKFNDFNLILEDKNIRVIGKSLFPF